MKLRELNIAKRGLCAMVCLLTAVSAWADDDIAALINANSDVQVEVINDAVNPWTITSANEVQCGNFGKQNSSSTLKFVGSTGFSVS